MMNKEMKSKEVVKRMRSGWLLRAFVPAFVVLSLIALSLMTLPSVMVTNAQPASPESVRMSGCPNVSNCLQQIEQKISKLRAYVRFLKPGDPVEFTQEPRSSSPQYRQGFETYKSLQEDLAALSQSSPWESSKPWPQSDAETWRKYLSDTQATLEKLGQASDRNAANAALRELSASEQRLSRHYKKKHYHVYD